jgi:DNA-binding transcriptional LysR family regulator
MDAYSILKNRVSMRHLRLLAALANNKSLRGAAVDMALTQPAVTKTLHEIESLLGATLFDRNNQGLVPTALGQAAIRYARLVFTDLELLHADLKVMKSGIIGNVRIGSMPALTTDIVADLIVRLKRDRPRVNLEVREGTSNHLLTALLDDQLDLVFGRIPQGWTSDDLVFESLGEETIEVVVRVGHPELERPGLQLRDLLDHTWIAQPRTAPLRDIHEQLFRDAQLPSPANVVETSSILLTVALLDRSDMITLLTDSLTGFYGKLGLMARLPLTVSARLPPFGVIRRRNRVATPAMQVVSEVLVEAWHAARSAGA